MWKQIKKFVLHQSTNTIGIDIGTGAIKLVEIAWQQGKPVLKKVGIKELPEKTIQDGPIIDHQQLTETLRQLLTTIHTDTKKVSLAVGGRMMFARELIFPSMTMEELGEAIKWDLGKYIPYAPGTYYFDFSIVGQGATENEMKVLLVASPLEHIINLMDMIKKVGLKLVAIDVEPLALYRTFDETKEVIMIDIGDLLSQVTMFHTSSPAVIRNIYIGGQNFTTIIMETLGIKCDEAECLKEQQQFLGQEDLSTEYARVKKQFESVVEELAKEIRHTVEYFQQQNNDSLIRKVFITGGGSKLNNLAQALGLLLGIPVLTYDPFNKLKIPSFFDKNYLEEIAPQLGIAIGLALRGSDL